MADEYITTSGILDDLNASNADFIAKQLESMGITNSQEVVMGKLNNIMSDLATGAMLDISDANVTAMYTADQLASMTEVECAALYNELLQAGYTSDALYKLTMQKAEANGTVITTDGDTKNLQVLSGEADATKNNIYNYADAKSGSNNVTITTNGDIANLNAVNQALANSIRYAQLWANAKRAIGSMTGDSATDADLAKAEQRYTRLYNIGQELAKQVSGAVPTLSGGKDKNSDGGNVDYKGKDSDGNTKGGGGGGGKTSDNEFSKEYDNIETKAENLQEKIDDALSKITSKSSMKTKETSYNNALKYYDEIVQAYDDGKAYYKKEMEKIKFSDDEKKTLDKIINGDISVTDIKDKDLSERIDKYKKLNDLYKQCISDIKDTQQAIIEAERALVEIEIEKVNDTINTLLARKNKLQDIIRKQELDGKNPNTNYKKLIDNNKEQISEKQAEVDIYEKLMKQLPKTSEEYKEYLEIVRNLNDEIRDLTYENEEYKASIRENRWAKFNKSNDSIDNQISEIERLRNLLNSDDFYDKDGNMTSTGYANLELIAAQIAKTEQQMANYRVGIQKLDEELKNGVITQEQYDEQLQEFLTKIQEGAGYVNRSEERRVGKEC